MDPQTEDSEAAKLNRMVMRKLQRRLKEDPEVDISLLIPSTYSTRLARRKAEAQKEDDPALQSEKREPSPSPFPTDDVRSLLDPTATSTVLFPLSESLLDLLGCDEQSKSLTSDLIRVAGQGEIMWEARFRGTKMVLKCGHDIVLKIMIQMDDTTEYTALQYLRQVKPSIPVPEPLGLVRMGTSLYLMFMSLVPGENLENAWPKLDESLKKSVQTQLHGIFKGIRSIPHEPDNPLGAVGGEGCKDLRRHTRHTKEPIWTIDQFDDWQFSNPHFGSKIYIEVLRRLSPPLPQKIVFSHNDLRTENIMVKLQDGQCHVTGIVDWQFSGFYPEYYECTKVMGSICPQEDCDWFLYIPDCIPPRHYPQKWLLDLVWWKHVE